MLELTKRLVQAAEGGDPVLLASVLEPGPASLVPGSRLLVEVTGERLGTLGDPALDALVAEYARSAFSRHGAETLYVVDGALTNRFTEGATSIYTEVVEPKPTFVVVGAGHIGRALAKLANFLGFHVAVIDDREEYADPELIPDAHEVICDDFEVALKRYPIGTNTHVVLVTRGHKQDELSLRCCLGRGAAYLGMIGSKRRTSTVLQHLRDEGFDPGELDRVRTPIGLDIGAETPEEIAVSIIAEVILLRRGGTGRPMYWRRGQGHLPGDAPA